MAQLSKGTTLSVDTTVTSQTLHDLIEKALISNIGTSDLIAGTYFISVSTSTPNPSNYPFWFNPDPEDPVVRVFARPWNIWLAIGPDRYEIPLYNAAATTVNMGALVAVIANAAASSFSVATNVSLNAIGFLQATTESGSWGPVATCGIGYVLHMSSTSDPAGAPSVGNALRTTGCPPGGVYGQGIGGNGGSGPMFGMFLESNRSGASGSGSRFRSIIWGPKLTVQLA